jgi:hypothetical protein
VVFLSIAIPSRFAEWCDLVIARLVEQSLGPAEVLHTDTLEQFALGLLRAKSANVVVGSRQMVGWLWSAIPQVNMSFILALDDPHLALENLVLCRGMDFVEATRIVAKSCASVVSCRSFSGALVLRASECEANPLAAAEGIARHLGLGVSETDIANIVAAASDLGIWPCREKDNGWWGRLESSQRTLVIGAIDPYIGCLSGADLEPITWERDLFFINEEQPQEQGQLASRPVEITGRPRCLVYGPYITLPPGSWSATVALGFSQEAAELTYMVDIHAGAQLTQTRIQPDGQRFVEASLNFSIVEPDMISIRISNERAAFDGRLALGHVVLTPNIAMRHGTRTYFEIALNQDVPTALTLRSQ